MRRKIDVDIGQRYGRWTVLEELGGSHHRKLLCRCDCGIQRAVRLSHLRDGSSLSCGCLSAKRAKERGGNIVVAQAGRELKLYEGTNIAMISRPQSYCNSSTGVLGVSPYYKRFKATLKLRGKQIYLGVYDTIEDAAEARRKGEERYFNPVIEEYNRQRLDHPTDMNKYNLQEKGSM